jgi:hypothetical protein
LMYASADLSSAGAPFIFGADKAMDCSTIPLCSRRFCCRIVSRWPPVFRHNLQWTTVRGSGHPREMPLVTRMQELQAEQRRGNQWHPWV